MKEDNLAPEIDFEELWNGIVHPVTSETITKYQKLIDDPLSQDEWSEAMCKELGRLAQGYIDITGTNTIRFLTHEEIRCIPRDRTVKYARIIVDCHPQKADKNRVQITVRGNLTDYQYELTTCTADLITTNLVWNSPISTPWARYPALDIGNMYLKTPLVRPDYMRMTIRLISQAIIDQWYLMPKVLDSYVYMEIMRGMYGLPQSVILAKNVKRKISTTRIL